MEMVRNSGVPKKGEAMKLINVDVLLDDIEGLKAECDVDQEDLIEKTVNLGLKAGIDILEKLVKQYPTFELADAYWIKGDECECSFCHHKQPDMTTYCPKCGSTMDGWYNG